MHTKNILYQGKELRDAKKAVIMLHGRGGSAEDIITLADHLLVKDFAIVAPQATNNTWYPYSFLAPPQQNEPWLSGALRLVNESVSEVSKHGIAPENIFFVGFSQGACLTLEYVSRNAQKWGGVAVFTGGLIGDRIYRNNYQGDFQQTPIFIGTSDPDPHVPVQRVDESVRVLKELNAAVQLKVYPQMGHTITSQEIDVANAWVFSLPK